MAEPKSRAGEDIITDCDGSCGSGLNVLVPHLRKRHLLILFAYLAYERGTRSRKVSASQSHRNQVAVSARLGLVPSASVAACRSSGSQRVAIPAWQPFIRSSVWDCATHGGSVVC
jgi:hypothetical protein